jgi:hypothetical protein
MEYFKKKRTFTGYVRKVDPKNKKQKQSAAAGGGDAGTKLVIILTLDCPITKPMRASMSSSVQAWIESNTGDKASSEVLEKVNPQKEKSGNYYTYAFTDEDKKEPAISRGGKDGGNALLTVERYFILEGEAFVQIKMVCDFDKELWVWCGNHLDKSATANAVRVDVQPLQGNLPGTE